MTSSNIYYVYQLRRSDSLLPFYVGKGKGNRLNQHFWKASLSTNTLKANCIKKAQREGVEVFAEKLVENLEEWEAYKMEADLIAKFGRREQGTGCLANMTNGGEGGNGTRQTIESNLKRSAALRGRVVSVETGRKISQAKRGKPGNRHTDETRKKMSASKLGIKKSPETIERMRLAAKKRAADRKLALPTTLFTPCK